MKREEHLSGGASTNTPFAENKPIREPMSKTLPFNLIRVSSKCISNFFRVKKKIPKEEKNTCASGVPKNARAG
jgi:hypothetical protein